MGQARANPVTSADKVQLVLAELLPRRLRARLTNFCAATGETALDVVADAVALHLDELDRDLELAAQPDSVDPAWGDR